MMECKVEKFESPGKGNGLWATSTMPAGELLYVCEPYVYIVTQLGRGVVCENCLSRKDHLQLCSRCKCVKYCSKHCQTEAWPDHKKECKLLKSVPSTERERYSVPSTERERDKMNRIRLVANVIFKTLEQTSPCPSEELYSVSDLKSHYKYAGPNVEEECDNCAVLLQSYLQGGLPCFLDLVADLNLPEWFAKVSGNHFKIYDEEMVNIGVGLYPSLSLLNHSCEPNCTMVCHGRQIHLRALTKIHIGDELTITYNEPLLPTVQRQDMLWHRYCFHCDCRRCATADMDVNMLAGDQEASDTTRNTIAKAKELQNQNKWDEALALCQAQLKSNEGRVPDENIYQLKILDDATEACLQLDMNEEALQYGNRSLEPYRLYNSAIRPWRDRPFMIVGMIMLRHQKQPEALKVLNEAFEMMKISYGMDHLVMTDTLMPILKLYQLHKPSKKPRQNQKIKHLRRGAIK